MSGPVDTTIMLRTSVGPREVAAKVFGALAVHPGHGFELLGGKPAWTITHVPSGTRVGGFWAFDSEASALACARILVAFPVDWDSQKPGHGHSALRDACEAVFALCDGFQVEDVMARPEGSA